MAEPLDRVILKRPWFGRYATIREYAIALIRYVDHQDDDGRDVGFDYGRIRNMVVKKFPTVTYGGPHKGRPTQMPYKELLEMVRVLNLKGIRLPVRPRRQRVVADPEKTHEKTLARQKRYDHSPKGRERRRRENSSPLGLEKHRRYNSSPKGIERQRRRGK